MALARHDPDLQVAPTPVADPARQAPADQGPEARPSRSFRKPDMVVDLRDAAGRVERATPSTTLRAPLLAASMRSSAPM